MRRDAARYFAFIACIEDNLVALKLRSPDRLSSVMSAQSIKASSGQTVLAAPSPPPVDFNVQFQSAGQTLLHLACHCHKKQIVAWLLGRDGIDLNARDKNGDTALMVALKCRNSEMAMLLLEKHMQATVELFKVQKPLVVESTHPWQQEQQLHFSQIHIPGAASYVVKFDDQTSTEQGSGFVRFYKDNTGQLSSVVGGRRILSGQLEKTYKDSGLLERFGAEKYSGGRKRSARNFPGVDSNPSLVIPAESFVVQWKTGLDFSRQEDWGVRMTVTPQAQQGLQDVNSVLLLAVEAGLVEVARRLLRDCGADRTAVNGVGESVLKVAFSSNRTDMIAMLVSLYLPSTGRSASPELHDRAAGDNDSNDGSRKRNEWQLWWFEFVNPAAGLANDTRAAVMELILQGRSADAVKELAAARDEDGRDVMGLTDKLTRSVLISYLYFCKR